MRIESIIHYMKEIQGKISTNIVSAFQGGQSLQQMAFMRQIQKDASNDQITVPLNELNVVIVDVETTGFHPEKGDKMISIGAIKMEGANILEQQKFYSLIHDETPLPEKIVKLTGINDSDLNHAPSRFQVLKEFLEFIKNLSLVAHHSNHEKNFFQHEYWKLFRVPFHHRIIDTSFLTRIVNPSIEIKTLDEYCHYHQIEVKKRHHAMEDAILTAKLWSLYIEKVQEMGFNSLLDIYEYISSK